MKKKLPACLSVQTKWGDVPMNEKNSGKKWLNIKNSCR
jgi:hypothetical protein